MSTNPLGDLIRDRLHTLGVDHVSARALGRRCGISKDTARFVLTGQRHVREATLQALAGGLGLPIQALRRAAGVQEGERAPFVAPPEWDRLTHPQRQALYAVAAHLLGTDRTSPVGGARNASSATDGQVARFAARKRRPNGSIPSAVFDDGT